MSAERLYREALQRFARLFEEAQRAVEPEPTAVVLATADRAGRPSARAVLLKGFDERGFVFYTNLSSRKVRQLRENPCAALLFFWAPMRVQVEVEGRVEPVSDEEADAYWLTRPRKSQLGAWASQQSETLDSRRDLLARFAKLVLEYRGRPVPRPSHWSGLRLVPERIEFWRSRPHRLHERVLYEKRGEEWGVRLLYP